MAKIDRRELEEFRKVSLEPGQEVDGEIDEIPIRVKFPGEGVIDCVLIEMDGEERDKYMDKDKKNYDRNGNLANYQDVQTKLIQRILHRAKERKRFDKAEIRTLSSKAQKKLYMMCLKLNGFGPDAEEEAKND